MIYRPAGPLSCPRGSELSFAYSHGTVPPPARFSLATSSCGPSPVIALRVVHLSSFCPYPPSPDLPPPSIPRLPVNLSSGPLSLYFVRSSKMQPEGYVLRTDFSLACFPRDYSSQSILPTPANRPFYLLCSRCRRENSLTTSYFRVCKTLETRIYYSEEIVFLNVIIKRKFLFIKKWNLLRYRGVRGYRNSESFPEKYKNV